MSNKYWAEIGVQACHVQCDFHFATSPHTEGDLWISSFGTTWMLERKVESRTLYDTYWIRICILTSSPCDSCAYESWKESCYTSRFFITMDGICISQGPRLGMLSSPEIRSKLQNHDDKIHKMTWLWHLLHTHIVVYTCMNTLTHLLMHTHALPRGRETETER